MEGRARARSSSLKLWNSASENLFWDADMPYATAGMAAEIFAVLRLSMLVMRDLWCTNRLWSCELGYDEFARWY